MIASTISLASHVIVTSFKAIHSVLPILEYVAPYWTMSGNKINFNTKHLAKGQLFYIYVVFVLIVLWTLNEMSLWRIIVYVSSHTGTYILGIAGILHIKQPIGQYLSLKLITVCMFLTDVVLLSFIITITELF
jgi:hypothetical protein